MPVVLLIEGAVKFLPQIEQYFQDKYSIITCIGMFKSIRSQMANQKSDHLYLVPNLEKPERYEIFILTKTNEQQFITITDEFKTASDKNVLTLKEFDGERIENELEKSWLRQTSAHKRSKGVSYKDLNVLKNQIIEANQIFLKRSDSEEIKFILEKCENTILRAVSGGVDVKMEDLLDGYKELVDKSLKKINK